jgi:sigma-B regulation protein RsbU (phosphoserine phosphatase)
MNNEACMFVRTFYGIYHLETGLIEYANAGHIPPRLLKANGTQTSIARNGGIPLGILQTSSYSNNQFTLNKGDCLILYTDGMIEARNSQGDPYGEERFAHDINDWTPGPLATLTTHLLERLQQFTQDTSRYDDVTLLCLRANP